MRFTAQNLVVSYPGAVSPALNGVSFDVPGGCFYAVLGPNGSGKSTLMRALLGVAPVSSGSVAMDGKDITALSRRDLARLVGAVPQAEAIAFPLTARELVSMGRYPHLGALSMERSEDHEAIDRALRACDVESFADRDVTTLSGGELQRVRIARALAQEPRSLILDEPTASLDVHHAMAILELLRESADNGMTVILITHGLDLAARFADRMLLLSHGRVAAEGQPAEVLDGGVLERVYRWPVSVLQDPATGAPRVVPLPSRSRSRDQGTPSG